MTNLHRSLLNWSHSRCRWRFHSRSHFRHLRQSLILTPSLMLMLMLMSILALILILIQNLNVKANAIHQETIE